MNFPSPEQVRSNAKLQNGEKAINWKVVDDYLRKIKVRGHLSEFARKVKISMPSLMRRRAELGLPKLAKGRPKVTRLTPREEGIMKELEAGKRPTDIANERDITIQAVSNTVRVVAEKFDLIERTCKSCNGYGVVDCRNPTCDHGRKHAHVCDPCGGNGVFPKKPERNDVSQGDPNHGQ